MKAVTTHLLDGGRLTTAQTWKQYEVRLQPDSSLNFKTQSDLAQYMLFGDQSLAHFSYIVMWN